MAAFILFYLINKINVHEHTWQAGNVERSPQTVRVFCTVAYFSANYPSTDPVAVSQWFSQLWKTIMTFVFILSYVSPSTGCI